MNTLKSIWAAINGKKAYIVTGLAIAYAWLGYFFSQNPDTAVSSAQMATNVSFSAAVNTTFLALFGAAGRHAFQKYVDALSTSADGTALPQA